MTRQFQGDLYNSGYDRGTDDAKAGTTNNHIWYQDGELEKHPKQRSAPAVYATGYRDGWRDQHYGESL